MSASSEVQATPSLPALIAKAFHDDSALIELAQAFAPATIERIAGQLILSPGTGGKTGRRNSRLTRILDEDAETHAYVSFEPMNAMRARKAEVVQSGRRLILAVDLIGGSSVAFPLSRIRG